MWDEARKWLLEWEEPSFRTCMRLPDTVLPLAVPGAPKDTEAGGSKKPEIWDPADRGWVVFTAGKTFRPRSRWARSRIYTMPAQCGYRTPMSASTGRSLRPTAGPPTSPMRRYFRIYLRSTRSELQGSPSNLRSRVARNEIPHA